LGWDLAASRGPQGAPAPLTAREHHHHHHHHHQPWLGRAGSARYRRERAVRRMTEARSEGGREERGAKAQVGRTTG